MNTARGAAILITLTLTLALLAFLLSGCTGEDGIVIPDASKGYYREPQSPDPLMANFAVAYGTRDLEGYAATLHPDFIFVTTASYGDEPQSWDRAEELRIAANMFSGESRVRDGAMVPGIARIEFVRCVGLGVWEPVTLPNLTGEALRRIYDVDVRFARNGGADLRV